MWCAILDEPLTLNEQYYLYKCEREALVLGQEPAMGDWWQPDMPRPGAQCTLLVV